MELKKIQRKLILERALKNRIIIAFQVDTNMRMYNYKNNLKKITSNKLLIFTKNSSKVYRNP